jgi:outer membrane protein insertion porin family
MDRAGVLPACAQDANPSPTQSTNAEQPPARPVGPYIGEFVVIGNKNLNETFITSLTGYKVNDPFSDLVLDMIRTNLITSGYFGYAGGDFNENAVRVYVEESAPIEDRKKVVIEISEENPKIQQLEIEGSGPIPVSEIAQMVPTGAVFRINEFDQQLRNISALYQSRGYVVTVLSDGTGLDPQKEGVLRIALLVARIKEIRIAKNNKTRPRTVLREMRSKPGGFYNANDLDKDRQRLFNLDLFEEIVPTTTQADEPGQVIVTLSIPEKRSGQLLFGAGFSNRQQFIGFAQIGDTNFRGLGESLNLRWESGGIANRSTINLSFVQPWLDKRHTSLAVSAYDRIFVRFANRLNNDFFGGTIAGTGDRYFETRTGGTVTLSRPFRDNTVNVALTLRGESVRTTALALAAENAAILQNGPIASVAGRISLDTRDQPFDPIRGTLQSFGLEVGVASLRPVPGVDISQVPSNIFGRSNFVKGELDYRYFIPIAGRRKKTLDEPKSTVALHLQFGLSSGRLPFFEQYFVGGADSLRGYREDRFWGSNRFLFQTELRQPLARSLTGVVFFDVGSAWGGPYSNINLQGFTQTGFRPHYAVGLGVRVRTPIGPIRFDYGFGDEGGRSHISIANVF